MTERKGIVHGMPNDIYHGGQEISNSALSAACRSLAHYQAYLQNGSGIGEKTALDGNIIHTSILEPTELWKRYAIGPTVDKRTKAGKEEWLAFQEVNEGKEVITAEQGEMATSVLNNVTGDDAVLELLEHGKPEASIFWNDAESGLDCRCRPDWLGIDTIIDVKSTDDARQFAKSVMQYGYHRQQSFYMEGAGALDLGIERFLFLVVEKKPPFGFMIYELDLDLVEYGWAQWRSALNAIAQAKFSGEWPGYSSDIQAVAKPAWL